MIDNELIKKLQEEDYLVQISLEIESDKIEDFNFNKASLLQGVIMENISYEYAEKMHGQGLKPYSQSVRKIAEKNIWQIRTLNKEAFCEIAIPILSDEFNSFTIKHNDAEVKIVNKEINYQCVADMFKDFYSSDVSNIFKVEFVTPTAFKSDGKYMFYPEISNIYRSLMKKFDSVLEKESMYSDETFEQLIDCSEVIAYSLYSVSYSLESVKIPAFMGKITIKIKGPQTMVNFANMLFKFGNYSGVGIKSAIGMGQLHYEERRRNEKK